MYQITGWESLSNLALLLIAVLLSKNAFKHPYLIKTSNRVISIILIFVLYLFAFHDLDYIGYKFMVDTGSIHFEDIYFDIIDLVQGNYFLFRLVVFGSAYGLMVWAILRLNVEFDLTFLFYLLTSVTILSYSRFTLALSLSFFGYTLLIKPYPKLKIISYLIGGYLMYYSLSFHRSALVLMPIYLLSFFFRNINRRSVIPLVILLISIVVFYYIQGESIMMQIVSSEELEEFDAGRAVGFSGWGRVRGIGIIIANLLQHLPYYLSLFLMFICVAKFNFRRWPIEMRSVSVVFALTVITAIILSIRTGNVNASVLYYRLLYYSSLSMFVFLAFCYRENIRRRFVKTIALIAFAAQIYEISYHAYHSFLGLYVM